ncbi:signal transduction histidine kinase [Sphingobium chlorophenolicum L-1]|uniref:histidine kinase n=1 Tax=Sphingobium chlorophenolicum L-1 TaxID=690566 RepID=F6F2D4_SPHCR|nr:sensor histidine kinase [Sphingobium chlorophenolicum]AEG50596.1 signal transduction histidine kinase [Sphingobium chlorophenolicum L-1]
MTTETPTDSADFLLLFDACPFPQVQLGSDNRILRSNPALARLLGVQPGELTGGRLLPSDTGGKAGRLSWDEGKCEALVFVESLVTAADYRVCMVRFGRADPAADDRDPIRDVQHRLRNLIANVRSIFHWTAVTSGSIDHLTSHFLGRLDAVARIESNLALAESHGVEMHGLIMDELAAFAVRPGEHAVLSGPDVRLHILSAPTLALICHELANNSVKFGALGAEGEVRIDWWIDPAPPRALHIVWTESGGPYAPVVHSGFGMELLTRTLPFELDGTADIHCTVQRFKVHMRLPVTDRLLHGGD